MKWCCDKAKARFLAGEHFLNMFISTKPECAYCDKQWQPVAEFKPPKPELPEKIKVEFYSLMSKVEIALLENQNKLIDVVADLQRRVG